MSKRFIQRILYFVIVTQTIAPSITLAKWDHNTLYLEDDEERIDYSSLIPIGKNSRTNLYWDGDRRLYGEDGTYIYLIEIIPDTIRNGKLELEERSGVISTNIDADSIYGNGSLTFESTLPLIETSYIICDSVNNEDKASFSVSIVDIPIGTPYRRNLLAYISSTLFEMYEELCSSPDGSTNDPLDLKLFVPTDNTSIKDIENYYASELNTYFSTQTEYPYYFHFSFEKALESKDYVTYLEHINVRAGLGSFWGYGTHSYVSFDKRNGKEIALDDIIDMKYECILRYLLRRDMISQNSMQGFLTNVPIGKMALSQNGLVFSYHPWELTIPNDLIFNLFIQYNDLKGLTKNKISTFRGLKPYFHKAVILREKEELAERDNLYYSSENVANVIHKVDNNIPLSTLWEIGYGYDYLTKEELITYRDSLIYNGDKNNIKVLNKLISEKEKEKEIDIEYIEENYFDLESESLTRAYDFIKNKSWDMAIEHILIALANQPTPKEDSHNSYISRNSVSAFFSVYPYYKEESDDCRNKYIDNVLLLGDISMQSGHKTDAIGYYKRAASILNYLLTKTFQESFPQKRKAFWEHYSDWYMNSIPDIAYKTNDDTLKIAAYNSALIGKGLLLNTDKSERQAIYDSKDSVLIGLLEHELYFKSQIVTLEDSIQILHEQLKKSSQDEFDDYKTTYDSLLNRRLVISDLLSKTIADKQKKIISLGRFHQNLEVCMSDISNILKNGEIAIEFTYHEDKNTTTYYAISIKKGQKVPSITRLFTEERLPDVESLSQDLKKLYHLVWEPLKDNLKGIDTIYFSPTKCLNQFSIEYAISRSGIPLNQAYKLYRLSSTREIFTRRVVQFNDYKTDDAALFGGLIYDVDNDFLKRDNVRYSSSNRGGENRTDYLIRKDKHFSYLPGTISEVKAIKEVLEDCNMFDNVFIYQDTIGTENLFKSLSGKHLKLIHIATHGGIDEFDILREPIGSESDIYDNELRKAYLVFAGANASSNNSSSTDGLVDGLEISSMNLSDLDIAVLSTCESGKGTISNEGVLGLQNAFKKAGAWTMIMSLRRVHDDATRLLMTYFYEEISQGISISAAFLNAQRKIREYRNGIYSDPYYWANFVIMDAI